MSENIFFSWSTCVWDVAGRIWETACVRWEWFWPRQLRWNKRERSGRAFARIDDVKVNTANRLYRWGDPRTFLSSYVMLMNEPLFMFKKKFSSSWNLKVHPCSGKQRKKHESSTLSSSTMSNVVSQVYFHVVGSSKIDWNARRASLSLFLVSSCSLRQWMYWTVYDVTADVFDPVLTALRNHSRLRLHKESSKSDFNPTQCSLWRWWRWQK
jgi:hypothetical protein